MMEFIQVTAQYSNAVLAAIMPQISDFATKLQLPVPLPITVAHVREFRCAPLKDYTGGVVMFTNHLQVSYMLGHVNGFRTPRSYYNLQDPEDIPRFYGTLRLNQDQALEFARENIRKLGFTLKETFTDQEPEIDLPPRIGTNVVPHYRFQWKDPLFGRTCVSIEVDADKKLVHELQLMSLYFSREPPKIAIEVESVVSVTPISAAISNQFLARALPKITAFAKRLRLPLKLPVTIRQVEKVAFTGFDSETRIKLVSGNWFVVREEVVVEFSAPDTIYGRQPPLLDSSLRPFTEYLGKWKMNDQDAIASVRQAIQRLGYEVNAFHADKPPNILKPDPVGKYIVPRYSFRWLNNDTNTGATVSVVRAEMDANKKRLVYLSLMGGPLRRKADVPIFQVETTLAATNQNTTQPNHKLTNAPSDDVGLNDTIKFLEKAMRPTTNPPTTLPGAIYE